VFTGNHWGKDRAIQAGLAPASGQTLVIHGKGWDKVKPLARHTAGVAAYDELPAVYASAKLVLDDTQEPTLRYDAVNAPRRPRRPTRRAAARTSRPCRFGDLCVFDALAAGSLVLTNCVAGARELFDDEFPVWKTPEQMRAHLDALLADPRRRQALADRYREVVLTRHTYALRAHRLAEVLHEREALPSFCIRSARPTGSRPSAGGPAFRARDRARAAPARASLPDPGAQGRTGRA